jgi:hypothetical protein
MQPNGCLPGGNFYKTPFPPLAPKLHGDWQVINERQAPMKDTLGSLAVFSYFCGLLAVGLFQGF